MEIQEFLEETRKGIIAIHREVKPFYHKLDYGNLRGNCDFILPNRNLSGPRSYSVSVEVDCPDFEEQINEFLQKKPDKHLIQSASYNLFFEWAISRSTGLTMYWYPDGMITSSYQGFTCQNSDEACMHFCNFIKNIPTHRREDLEKAIREHVFEKGGYNTVMDYLIAETQRTLRTHRKVSPTEVCSAEEIAFALELEKRLGIKI